jgi:hypothetical protein
MYCSICGKRETQVSCSGIVSATDSPHTNAKGRATAMICSQCTYLLSQCAAKIDWEMDLEGLKEVVNNRQQRGTLMCRTK